MTADVRMKRGDFGSSFSTLSTCTHIIHRLWSVFEKEEFILAQNRLKSKIVWAALAAQVITLLLALGVIDPGQGESVQAAVTALLQALVLFGVLNNPTDSGGF